MNTFDCTYEDNLWQSSPTNNGTVRTLQNTTVTEETILKVNNSGITYQKGGSAGSQGVKFQVNLLVVSLLNAFRGLSNWKLSTENKKAGKFDDVVLEWSSGSILLQAKHRQNKFKRITFEELFSANSKNDEFSLPKYFLSYHNEIKNSFKIKNVMICTNVSLNDKILKYVNIQKVDADSMLYFEGNDCSFYTFKEEIVPYLKETVKSYLEKNPKNNDACNSTFSDEDFQNFLEHFQFYSDYPGKNNFEEVIKNILSKINLHHLVSSLDVFGTVMDWFQQKRGIYLTETHVKGMFLEIWRNKYWLILDQYNIEFKRNDFNFQHLKGILYVISKNPYLLLELKIYNALKDKKANVLHITSNDDVDVLKQAIEAFELSQYLFLVIIWPKLTEELTKWDKLKHVLVHHDYKRVIVLSENSELNKKMGLDENSYEVVTGSVKLEDLSEHTRERLLKMENIIFQGTEISLEKLIKPQTMPVSRELIDSESLDMLIKGEKIKVGIYPLGLDQHISRFYVNRVFKRNEDDKLENINEDSIFQVNAKTILISDVAGMGKSTVLTNLAVIIKKTYPHLWVIRIELSDYTSILNDMLENNETVISITQLLNSKQTTEFTNALEQSVFSLREKVVLLLDGLDEISPDYTELILSLLSECQEASNFAKIFITTRPHMTELLEKKLAAITFTLQPFTEGNQIRFFITYWTHKLKLTDRLEKKCEQYARVLIRKMIMWIKTHRHFAEIPLQAKMLAEIFQQNDKLQALADLEGCKEFLSTDSAEPKLPERMNIINLYEVFLHKKRKVFISKGNPNGNVMANKALNHQFDECISYSRSLALEMILGKCKCRHFSDYRKGDTNLKEIALKIGIVQTTNDELQFVHRTFAEYLVAESVLMELQLPNQSEDFQRVFGEILLDTQYIAVRTFVDSFLQKNGTCLSSNINYQFTISDDGMENVQYKSYWVHLLAKEGFVEILRLLLQSPDFKIVRDDSAPQVDERKCRRCLIMVGGVDTEDESGRTSLHLAARHNHLEVVKFLVEQGAVVNACHKIYGPPLASAVLHGHLEVVQYLVEQGADIRAKDGVAGVPIVFKAIISKNSIIITYLLETVLKTIDSKVNDLIAAYSAAYLGRLDILEELIAQGLNVNDDVVNGETLIFGASRGRQLDTVEYLVDMGANISIVNNWKKTALHVISEDPLALATGEILIELGIDMDAVDNEGRTALHLASTCGNIRMENLLVRVAAFRKVRRIYKQPISALLSCQGHRRRDFYEMIESHFSPLSMSVSYGKVREKSTGIDLYAPLWHKFDFAEYLMDNPSGIYINHNNDQPISDLRWETIERLLEYGADVNVADNQGRTIVHEAALGGYLLELFQIGLTNEVLDVNVQGYDGLSALHLCALKNQRKTLEFLLEHGADANIKDMNGFTALHLCTSENHLDVAELLVKYGADMNTADDNGFTALHLCAWRNQLRTLELLLEHGADANVKDNDGYTALHMCALKNNLDVAKMLIKHGVDINTIGNKGCTALHLCASGDKRKVLEFLLECGADANFKDDYGYTALHVSALKNHLDIVEPLAEHGVDVNVRDNRGYTALDLCKPKTNRKQMIDLLAKHGIITNQNHGKMRCLLL